MRWKSFEPQTIRDAAAFTGAAMLALALWAVDWRLGVGFAGACLLTLGLVGTIRA